MKTLLADKADDEVQVWPSYTDVAMNVVLVLLIYLFAQAVIASQTTAALVVIREAQSSLRNEIQTLPENVRRYITVTDDGNLLKLTFSDRVLFASGRAEITEEGHSVLGQVGSILKRRLETFDQIQVEGHTDNVPMRTAGFSSNWELSSARATKVVEFLENQTGIRAQKMSATGYSEYRPVAPNDTEEGRARNRRIAMLIVYSTRNVTRTK